MGVYCRNPGWKEAAKHWLAEVGIKNPDTRLNRSQIQAIAHSLSHTLSLWQVRIPSTCSKPAAKWNPFFKPFDVTVAAVTVPTHQIGHPWLSEPSDTNDFRESCSDGQMPNHEDEFTGVSTAACAFAGTSWNRKDPHAAGTAVHPEQAGRRFWAGQPEHGADSGVRRHQCSHGQHPGGPDSEGRQSCAPRQGRSGER